MAGGSPWWWPEPVPSQDGSTAPPTTDVTLTAPTAVPDPAHVPDTQPIPVIGAPAEVHLVEALPERSAGAFRPPAAEAARQAQAVDGARGGTRAVAG